MEYRTLGKTGLRVSRLGCGGIPIQRIDAEGTRKLLHRLLAEGVNFVDTARGYTVSEEYLGYGLEGIREHFVLATKSHGLTREEMEQDVKTSLQNLRTDYIDLYQFHNPTPEDLAVIQAPGGALEYLQEAKKTGHCPPHRPDPSLGGYVPGSSGISLGRDFDVPLQHCRVSGHGIDQSLR